LEYTFAINENTLKLTKDEFEFYTLFMLFSTATLDRKVPSFVRIIIIGRINGFRNNLKMLKKIKDVALNHFLNIELIIEIKE
jgi:hypothetical protein